MDHRVAREVATERDLLNLAGIFYELPAENAGGYAMARPVSTHNRRIHDFCSWHGLLMMSGVELGKTADPHVVTAADGKAALWAGAIDDLWKFGAPHGSGGPWLKSAVKAGKKSDPFLMSGFGKKKMTLESTAATTLRVEMDLTGYGDWALYESVDLLANEAHVHPFPDGFGAYWIRFASSKAASVSAMLEYR